MDFNAEAETWDDEPHRWERSARIAAAIRRAVDLTDRPRTLELGAGTGLLARALADDLGAVTLTDSAARMVEVGLATAHAAGHVDWDGAVVDLGSDPLPPGPYDLVISQLALHHVGDVATVLAEVGTVLAPGGRVALVDLDADPHGLFHRAHPDFDGHDGFAREDLVRWLTAAGCTRVEVTTATELVKEVDGVERTFPLFLAVGVTDPDAG
ncbi:MAG TPA: class I SAM-dependent methyltransferase [Intrasporangiaceae bacterium]|nr:class I SAM-dependent methyltransferase [Intrasporangiaceae bacterium]